MLDIEQSVTEWRRQMLAADIKSPELLDELESHLRADTDALVASGKPGSEAFQLAVSRLGTPLAVRTEFDKIENASIWPVKIGSRIWALGTLLMLILFAPAVFTGKREFLLTAHIAAITSGYRAIFLTGAFSLCYVWFRMFDTLSPRRVQSLNRSANSFIQIAAGLLALGTMLGMFWSHGKYGVYARGGWREAGVDCVSAWIISLWAMQRLGWLRPRATMLLCIGGNIVVSLAWFGAVGMAAQGGQGLPMKVIMPLAVFVAINLCALIIGLAPVRSSKEA